MDSIKQILLNKLIDQHRFWSINLQSDMEVPDDILIEKSLIYLDIEDINQLFAVFPAPKIKHVWRERLVVQGEYYQKLNRLLAWMYFDVKNPDKYIKRVMKDHLKKLS